MRALRETFFALADDLQGMLVGDERYLATFTGEDSDFVRLNHGRIRQGGHVAQRQLSVDLISGRRHASGQCSLGGERDSDRAAVARLVAELREQRRLVGDDPHLLYSEDAAGHIREDADRLPDSGEAIAAVLERATGLDLVGIWASGGIHAGFASSFGQRSWHSAHTFNVTWSCYLRADRAVSCRYAGTVWDLAELDRRFADARRQLAALDRAPAAMTPGRYRAYLAPAALHDWLAMLGRGGFSCKAHRTRTTPLLRLAAGEASLHREITLVDDRAAGLSPLVSDEGFRLSDRVPLITAGKIGELLVSPRSAKEFGLTPNSGEESPAHLSMAAGSLDRADALARLGTGLWIDNVWYCNYSDRNACRITGLTRFACFWVEDGEIAAPLPVMRFDDSIYGILGDRLLGITAQREQILSASTYGGRSTSGMLVPGVLVGDFALTL